MFTRTVAAMGVMLQVPQQVKALTSTDICYDLDIRVTSKFTRNKNAGSCQAPHLLLPASSTGGDISAVYMML